MIDTTLINKLEELCKQERKIKGFKNLLRVRGKIKNKSLTKKGNIKLKVKRGEDIFRLVVFQSHKERFKLAEKLVEGNNVSVIGIKKLGFVLCTKLKLLDKEIDESQQVKLGKF